MFWNKKTDQNPLGVPLGDIQAMLAPTTIKTTLKGNFLLARHEQYTVRIEVVPPATRESENGPIRAVVCMTTDLQKKLLPMFKGRENSTTAVFNAFAALGALYSDGGTIQLGSRLTIYEEEDSWGALHLPLLLFTTIAGNEAILGGMRRTMASEAPQVGHSDWNEQDFEQVKGYLSRLCVCTTGGMGLSAEFPLVEGAVSAAGRDHGTALFQMMADEPHPELGGGLFCLLQMKDENALHQICMQLNTMEMDADDMPPHFGAWCPGRLGNNPSYISFLPNSLHIVSGIATNAAFWAMSRATWAHKALNKMGVSLS
jgi:hypothetical protein